MDKEHPQCLYCGGFNLQRVAIKIGYECLDCNKFMTDMVRHWSYLEKGKIKNDLDGRIATLNSDGESFTLKEAKVEPREYERKGW
jgi:hypothetical protein